MKRIVKKSYHAFFPHIFSIKRGEILKRKNIKINAEGMIAVENASGRSGWIPDFFLVPRDSELIATFDYSSRELSAKLGETLDVIFEFIDWAFCENQEGIKGWIPIETFK